jgi:HK97 family phage major capsid protein
VSTTLIEDLEAAHERAVEELHDKRTVADETQQRIATAEEGADLDALENEASTASKEFEDAAAEVERTKKNLADASKRAQIAEDNPAVTRATTPAVARGGKHELTYRPDNHDYGFLRDAWAYRQSGNPAAAERLSRNSLEMYDLYETACSAKGIRARQEYVIKRDVGTAAFDGLTVPQYLIDLFAPFARAGSPYWNSVTKSQLPSSGMVMSISRLTTGTAVAAQASENAAVQETDADDTRLDVNIRQYAGQQDVSRQALERSEGVGDVIFNDLMRAWFSKVDADCINGLGTSGTILGALQTSGIITVTYTDASPTVPEVWPKIHDSLQQINSNVFNVGATTIHMHPSRWGWFLSQLDTANRPFVTQNTMGPFNAYAVGEAAGYGQVMGTLAGLPVITDGNIPSTNGVATNQDVIISSSMPEIRGFQDGDGAPRRFTFEQSNAPQSIRLAVWGDVAYTAGRYPKATAQVSGTGLTAATF